MKSATITLAILSFTISGCVKYQYLSIDSSMEESTKGFVTENDSIRLSYWFTGSGVMEIEIHNLSNELIYVDWNKSSLIKEGESFTLASNQATLEANSSSIEWLAGIESGEISGTITTPSSTNFIPGGSYIRYRARKLNLDHYNLKLSAGVEKRNVHGYQSKILEIDQSEADGFQTRLFLANESDKKRSIYQHEFWISTVMETQYNDPKSGGNQVKLSKTTGAGKVLSTVGGLALLTIYVAAELEEE